MQLLDSVSRTFYDVGDSENEMMKFVRECTSEGYSLRRRVKIPWLACDSPVAGVAHGSQVEVGSCTEKRHEQRLEVSLKSACGVRRRASCA